MSKPDKPFEIRDATGLIYSELTLDAAIQRLSLLTTDGYDFKDYVEIVEVYERRDV